MPAKEYICEWWGRPYTQMLIDFPDCCSMECVVAREAWWPGRLAQEMGDIQRGCCGGVSEAARQAGVSRRTAQRQAAKPASNEQSAQVSERSNVQSLYEKCPMCQGAGQVPRIPARTASLWPFRKVYLAEQFFFSCPTA
jgi:hypothetical protein